ncbi:hypothetical protein D3C77_656500 [compost metagenome]
MITLIYAHMAFGILIAYLLKWSFYKNKFSWFWFAWSFGFSSYKIFFYLRLIYHEIFLNADKQKGLFENYPILYWLCIMAVLLHVYAVPIPWRCRRE